MGDARQYEVAARCFVAASFASCARAPMHVANNHAGYATDTAPPVINESPPASAAPELRVATFNAGLAVGAVKFASERVEAVAHQLPRIDADLVCLQEVWLEEHWSRIADAAKDSLPNAVRLNVASRRADATSAATGAKAVCSAREVAPLTQCAKRRCANLSSDALAACVIWQCRSAADRLSPECASCLASDPTGTLDTIVEPCVSARADKQATTVARAGLLAYGGSHGLGVLTREPVLASDVRQLGTDLNARAALYARLKTLAVGEVDVFCTHLTPDMGSVVPSGGRSWRDVHAEELDGLRRWIDVKFGGMRFVLLVGDFNAGPSLGSTIVSRFPEDYEKLVSDGFVNAYTLQPNALCTFCEGNPLNRGTGDSGSLIDHILTKRFDGFVSVEPILRDSVELRVGEGRVRGAYSDHYGLKATLRRTRG